MAKKIKIDFESIHLFAKFHCFLFTDYKEWNKLMDLENESNSKLNEDDICLGMCSCYYSTSGLTLCMYIKLDNYEYETAIHESCHIVDYLMDSIGIKNDTEFRAYSVGNLSREVIEFVSRKLNGKLCNKD